LDVKIEAVGQKGDGIAKEKGFVLFIPGVKQGDEVRVRVTKVLRNVGFAEVVGKAVGGEAPKEESQDSESFGEQAEEAEEEQSEEPSEDKSEDSEDFGDEEQQ
jgi:predicted RNA-binding protein with TRAM domain